MKLIENLQVDAMAMQTDFPSVTRTVWNRTNGPTVKGNIYYFDVRLRVRAEADGFENSLGDKLPAVTNYGFGKDGAFGSIVNSYASYTEIGGTQSDQVNGLRHVPCCVALQSVPDNEQCDVCIMGECDINMGGITGGTTLPGIIPAWVKVLVGLTNTAGPTAAGLGSIALAAGGQVKVVAVTLEQTTWAASNTPQTVTCYFNGINGAFGA